MSGAFQKEIWRWFSWERHPAPIFYLLPPPFRSNWDMKKPFEIQPPPNMFQDLSKLYCHKTHRYCWEVVESWKKNLSLKITLTQIPPNFCSKSYKGEFQREISCSKGSKKCLSKTQVDFTVSSLSNDLTVSGTGRYNYRKFYRNIIILIKCFFSMPEPIFLAQPLKERIWGHKLYMFTWKKRTFVDFLWFFQFSTTSQQHLGVVWPYKLERS